jgi:hypothetical protein
MTEHDDLTEEVLSNLGVGSNSVSRLKRIMVLRKCNAIDALEFALSVGWAAAEKRGQK